ncbi:nuclear transport factor 2 family protein [Sphingobium sp. AN558]|uniref:nuclear transport factor 2 family protein n=1 Tax=Sphingobium sp. AN558 TaxID=3133442 RepID=UPI0030C2994F
MSAALSHIVLGTNRMAKAESFYTPVLAMLGWRRRFSEGSPDKLLWQPPTGARPLFGVMQPFDGAPHSVGNGAMVALTAPDRNTVDAAYDLALSLGGGCEGPAGLRPHYHPHYYGAYFRDLDGNKIGVVCHKGDLVPAEVALSQTAMIESARAWIAAWNRRDVGAVLSSFHPNARFRSPVAEKTTGSAEIVGVDALRDYWMRAIAGIETLQFTLLEVLCDEARQSMAVVYLAELNGRTTRACELFRLIDGRKISGEALYACWQ